MSGIGELPGDVVWYRRRFDAPEAECLLLHFGAVDYRATVWVNDAEVARHEGGHTPFTADITGRVRPRDNVLVVRADDPLGDRTTPRGKQYWKWPPEGIFYTPTTGIWQTVWLEPLPSRHIEGIRLRPSLEAGAVDFEVAGAGTVALTARLGGAVVGRWSGPAGVGRLPLDHVAPWHPDSPALYDLECTLDGDRVDTYFGLRTVGTRDGRFLLNGEPFVQRLVLDQGYFPDSLLTAPTGDALRRDIELARGLGFNGARKHQKIEDPRWLYWADRLGFLVWSEMPAFHEHSAVAEGRLASEWAGAVRRDRDHPSVVAWVPANESFGLDQVDAAVRSDFLVRLYRLTRELDGTRPVVSNDGWRHSLTDLCTLHDYSPPDVLAARYRSLATALDGGAGGNPPYDPGFEYRGEPVLVTEFGGLRVAEPGGWGWLEAKDGDDLVRMYAQLIEALMDAGPVQGFCYTQLTDVEQEQNGLLTDRRRPKIDPARIAPATRTAKRTASKVILDNLPGES
ncbi:MAG TPA: glycoside hydrolase family 2 TIM barrel-domain containing protein [Candidatus Dormibacteraeota bacterium]|nr:glycoside hydrolase family 2 TIM barrel-domain containing protein [Candidatus Dormibacteraeota bacterium]